MLFINEDMSEKPLQRFESNEQSCNRLNGNLSSTIILPSFSGCLFSFFLRHQKLKQKNDNLTLNLVDYKKKKL